MTQPYKGPPAGLQPEAKPTVKQIYLLTRLLCKQTGREFPADRAAAHDLIEQLKQGGGEAEA